MYSTRGTINSLPVELIQYIGLLVATRTPTGPPTDLTPLLLTSQSLYRHLNRHANPHLYAKIYRIHFDSSFISRRFAPGQINARSLAEELPRRWTSLNRIRLASQGGEDLWGDRRRGLYSQELLREDLATAYLMFLESDGKNAAQLIHWAQIDTYLAKYQKHILTPYHKIPRMPPEAEETSLFLWLRWFCLDYSRAVRCPYDLLPWLTMPYVFGTFAYNGSYAPWPHHHLPLPSSSQPSPSSIDQPEIDPHLTEAHEIFTVNNVPKTRPCLSGLTRYFGLPLSISPPLLSQAATLGWLVTRSSSPVYDPDVPKRSAADLLSEMNAAPPFTSASTIKSGNVVDFFPRSYTPEYMQTRLPTITNSEVYDDEWKRLFCREPYTPVSRVKELGIPRYRYTKGSLAGEWDGRFVGMGFHMYERIMNGEPAINVLEEVQSLFHDMHSWRIEEHYPSKLYSAPLPVGDPLNAHLPAFKDYMPIRRWGRARWQKGLQIQTAKGEAYYETWDPTNPEEYLEDDEDDDEHIQVVVTGTAISRSPTIPASHGCSFSPGSVMQGTVRAWDGLITLKVDPIDSYLPSGEGQWIWSGYLIGSGPDTNWVGRYRHANIDVDKLSYEGVFTMVKRLET